LRVSVELADHLVDAGVQVDWILERGFSVCGERAIIAFPVQAKVEGRVEDGQSIDRLRAIGCCLPWATAGAIGVNIVAGCASQRPVRGQARIRKQTLTERKLERVGGRRGAE
jgi:hypothetical protein